MSKEEMNVNFQILFKLKVEDELVMKDTYPIHLGL